MGDLDRVGQLVRRALASEWVETVSGDKVYLWQIDVQGQSILQLIETDR